MKKILSILLCASLIMGLTACKSKNTSSDTESDTVSENSEISFDIDSDTSDDTEESMDNHEFFENTDDSDTYVKPESDVKSDIISDTDDKKSEATSTNEITETNISTCNIFRKVICCGDSYTAGYIADKDGNAHTINEDYAWPHYMSTLTGNDWLNCGCSGCNVLTWQKHSRGLPAAKKFGKAQAYVIGLMINDVSEKNHVELGTISDIGTDRQTYYGGMSAIIRELNNISPQAKIFVNTCPKNDIAYDEYNQAVRNIVNTYKDKYPVHCIDLAANAEMYNNESIVNDYWKGHYTALGYEQFAEIYSIILSRYINENISDFQDVAFIEYDK